MRSNFEELNYQRQNVVDQAIDDYFKSMSDAPPFADYPEDPQDCFELLSAYLDGEVTLEQRRQVQLWLDNDPKVQRLYTRLLRVQEALKHAPPPSVNPSATALSEQVFAKLDRQKQGRLYCVGGTMIAACFLATLSSLIFADNSPLSQIAGLFNSKPQSQLGLMIALNHPVVDIPETIHSDLIENNQAE